MDSNLKKLEYGKILEILSKYCITYMGKDIAKNLRPSNSKEVVVELLNETFEAVNLSYRNSIPGFYEIENIDIQIKQLESNNTLSCKSLLNLRNVFKLAKELKEYFSKDFIDVNEYNILNNLFEKLYTNKDIVDTISISILDEETIDDKASFNLSDIRKNQKKLEHNIRDSLNSFIHSSKNSKYIQENIITIRNDRFVIPVKAEYRSEVKGFVHDISNAGSTVFIEPIGIFEMNNELSKLKVEEEIEIEKILQKLTSLFFPYIEELKLDIQLIGKLDFIFAKAKYSLDTNSITPIINADKRVELKTARHPLINKELVVPISVGIGEEFSTLVITGPNTGGKTVCLKTFGLLCAMACSGLNIPCDENSSIFVFDKIYADIGDDQSLNDSLSTFSSHMVKIVEIVNNATKDSLILVDELGSGTDPVEGANLAISILNYLNKRDCITIATTHYQELKEYSLITNKFENASVEFDINTLKPTYKLLVGVPGKSNAFEISKNLGLLDEIIYYAKSIMTTEQKDIEGLLKSIYDNKASIEIEKKKIEEKLNSISELEKKLKKDNNDLKVYEQEIINSAKMKARDILLDAKEEADEIIKELHQIKNTDIKEADSLRGILNKKIKENSEINQQKINRIDKEKILKREEIKKGLEVFVKKIGENGIIVSNISKSNDVQVQIGIMKMNVNINELEKANIDKKNSVKAKIHTSGYTSISKTRNIKPEINVIGLNVEEAIFVVDKFLDDCSLAKLKTVRIVHGKGTGKLKNGIHQFLKKHPHVKSIRLGTFGEGEMGVTVVEL